MKKLAYLLLILSCLCSPFYNKKKFSEYFVPEKVLECYQQTINPEANFPLGHYIDSIYLDKEKLKKFEEKLEEKGYTKKEIEKFTKIFLTRDNIIYNEKITSNKDLKERVTMHERAHSLVARLGKKEKEILQKTWRNLLERGVFSNLCIYNPCAWHIITNREEFIPYIIDGTFLSLEDTLRINYPDAYKIYERIKKEVKENK
ncbi:MAG: hypothetical protein NZ889_01855 [Candidatus Pacearchaeota archaeon]|nr:hypothetical protein [Candidatus Pacearchaeota archaeon]